MWLLLIHIASYKALEVQNETHFKHGHVILYVENLHEKFGSYLFIILHTCHEERQARFCTCKSSMQYCASVTD